MASYNKWWLEKDPVCRWDALVNHIGVILHHLQSLMGAMELIVLSP